MGVTVGGSEPGDDFAAQPPRAQSNTLALHGDHKVADLDLALLRQARAAEIRNFIVAQNGPEEDVADASFRQVGDFGKDALSAIAGPDLLFSTQMVLDKGSKLRVGMAKASQQDGAGRAVGALQEERMPGVGATGRRRGENAHGGEGIRQRWRIFCAQGFQQLGVEFQHGAVFAGQLFHLAQQRDLRFG